jgi:hypothetical protein
MKNMKIGIAVLGVVFVSLTSCSGDQPFCKCIEEADANQLEFVGNCSYINDLSAEEFDAEMLKCELEGFEMLLR